MTANITEFPQFSSFLRPLLDHNKWQAVIHRKNNRNVRDSRHFSLLRFLARSNYPWPNQVIISGYKSLGLLRFDPHQRCSLSLSSQAQNQSNLRLFFWSRCLREFWDEPFWWRQNCLWDTDFTARVDSDGKVTWAWTWLEGGSQQQLEHFNLKSKQ